MPHLTQYERSKANAVVFTQLPWLPLKTINSRLRRLLAPHQLDHSPIADRKDARVLPLMTSTAEGGFSTPQ